MQNIWLQANERLDRDRAQSKRLAEMARVVEMATESVIIMDAQGRTTWVNRAFTEMSGYELEDVLGKRPIEMLNGPDTDPVAAKRLSDAIQFQRPVTQEILNYSKTSKRYWARRSIAPIPGENGGEMRFAAISTDITEIKEAQRELERAQKRTEHQASHDPLTGLPNRRYVDDVMERMMRENGSSCTIVRVDLDHFKYVNDTLGHAAGDYVLKQVADILRQGTRSQDMAGRVGGDEFVIVMGEGTTASEAYALTERLRMEIRKDMEFEGNTCRIGASFGIATSEFDLVDPKDLLKCADSALYLAKDAGRNKTVLYTPEIHNQVEDHRKLAAEIETAILNKEFIAHFQPQFEAHSEVMIGVEALARWNHPEKGVLSPDSFMEAAEKLKLVSEIDNLVYEYGLECISTLNNEGLFVPKIAFNVGVAQLMNPALVQIAHSKDIGFTHVSLEVLESVLIEEQDNLFMDRLQELRAEGFSIEVDDFGSGHASIVSLQQLQPHVMKIDRQLVAPMTQSEAARKLIKSIIEMGQALDIMVLAEGVETAEHAAMLRHLGCHAYQGFHFARPMSFEDLQVYARHGFDSNLGKVVSFRASAV